MKYLTLSKLLGKKLNNDKTLLLIPKSIINKHDKITFIQQNSKILIFTKQQILKYDMIIKEEIRKTYMKNLSELKQESIENVYFNEHYIFENKENIQLELKFFFDRQFSNIYTFQYNNLNKNAFII